MEQPTAYPADTHEPGFRLMANELCRPGLAEVSGAIRREASGAIRHEARSAIWRKASGAGAVRQEVGGAILTQVARVGTRLGSPRHPIASGAKGRGLGEVSGGEGKRRRWRVR